MVGWADAAAGGTAEGTAAWPPELEPHAKATEATPISTNAKAGTMTAMREKEVFTRNTSDHRPLFGRGAGEVAQLGRVVRVREANNTAPGLNNPETGPAHFFGPAAARLRLDNRTGVLYAPDRERRGLGRSNK